MHIDTQPFLLSDAFVFGSHCGGLYDNIESSVEGGTRAHLGKHIGRTTKTVTRLMMTFR